MDAHPRLAQLLATPRVRALGHRETSRVATYSFATCIQRCPVLAVKPDGTRLFVGFYDRRADPNNSSRHIFGRIADISGATVTFRTSFQVSASSFPVIGNLITAEGDYDHAYADSGNF